MNFAKIVHMTELLCLTNGLFQLMEVKLFICVSVIGFALVFDTVNLGIFIAYLFCIFDKNVHPSLLFILCIVVN